MKPPPLRAFILVTAVVGSISLVAFLLTRIFFGDETTTLDWFFLGSIAFGGGIAVFLRRSQQTAPSIADESRRPEISMHRIPVGGGVAGMIFAVGSCLIFLVGIPALRWFLLGAVLLGSAVGALLWRWHRNRPVQITDIHDIER
jgi:hypothetical protein